MDRVPVESGFQLVADLGLVPGQVELDSLVEVAAARVGTLAVVLDRGLADMVAMVCRMAAAKVMKVDPVHHLAADLEDTVPRLVRTGVTGLGLAATALRSAVAVAVAVEVMACQIGVADMVLGLVMMPRQVVMKDHMAAEARAGTFRE